MAKMRIIWVLAIMAGCSGRATDDKSQDMVVLITDSCPACAADEVCIDGFCQIADCEPVCEGSACAPNGCGGMCNPCEGRAQCIDGSCELAPMDCSGFAASATSWSIPAVFGDDALEQLADGVGDCSGRSEERAHVVLDLTGDGRLDLVFTDDCDAAAVGTDHWNVHENTGSGFANTPTSWSIPSMFGDDQLDRIADGVGDCALSEERAHQVLDLTGDGRPDLVLSDDCDAEGVGTDHWNVYENTGSGFASSPTAWSLPSFFGEDPLDQIADGVGDCPRSEERAHQLLDLTGDGRLDLVLTDDCDTAEVGTDHWNVYENTGSGFANTPTSWSIPTFFGDDQLDRIADGAGDCSGLNQQRAHLVMDLTGDRRPDLVLTDDCDAAGVGTDVWHVYENTGSGFASSPTEWSIPTFFGDDQLDSIADGVGDCSGLNQQRVHQVIDMNADGRPDLLLTDDCDAAGVGTDRWSVYENVGSGFAVEPTAWSVPGFFGDDQLERIADGAGDCSGLSQQRAHQVLDLDGDGALDLLLTDDCDAREVGTSHWQIYNASCN